MAGIGFRLQKLLAGDSYSDLLKAYAFSAIISAGPMLVVMVTLGIVKKVAQLNMGLDGEAQFMGLVVYVYAWSMIFVAPIFFPVTRYLADAFFLKEFDNFTPTYFSVLMILFPIQLLFGGLFLSRLSLPLSMVIWELILFLSVGGVWIAMLFLSAARGYIQIVAAFALGAAVSTVLGIWSGNRYGLEGFLSGFAIGQLVCLLILSVRIVREFGTGAPYNFSFLRYFRRYPMLAAIGLLYYVGIWIDKMCFWLSSGATVIFTHIRVMPDYDTPMFVAYLTVVPSLAFFLIQMETTFMGHYQAYYESVRRRQPMSVIRLCEEGIANNLSQQFQRFAVFQGLISGVAILVSPQIVGWFGMSATQIGVFRVAILGAYMQMGLIMTINILFYFDAQFEAMMLTLFFAVCNALFAVITMKIGLPAYGFGYTVTSFLSLLAGFFALDWRLRRLSYWTFMRQPVTIPRIKFDSER